MVDIESNRRRYEEIRVRKTLKIDDLRESFNSDECSIFFFFLCSLEFSPCQKSFSFVQTMFYLQSIRFDLILEEIRNLKRLKNDIVLRDELWPIDRLITHDRSALIRSRILLGSRSMGSHATIDLRSFCVTRIVGPIDRLVFRDRSASSLPFCFSSLQLLPIDRLICRDRSTMALFFSSGFPLLQNAPFYVLFHLDFRI